MKRIVMIVLAIFIAITPVQDVGAIEPSPFTEYNVNANACPSWIANGPDAALWFTNSCNDSIGRISVDGLLTDYPYPYAISNLGKIVVGSDNALWFTDVHNNSVGKITTSGVITLYPLPSSNSGLRSIVAGPDGNLWFTESITNKIGRITTSGVITEYSLPSGTEGPGAIISAPDGAIWISAAKDDKAALVRMNTTGVVTNNYFVTPPDQGIFEMTVGPDGAIWATGFDFGKIYKIVPSGSTTTYSVDPFSHPSNITAGPDGAIWFTQYGGNKIGRITATGVINEFQVPTNSAYPLGITAGPDGAIWFAELSRGNIGRLDISNLALHSLSAKSPSYSPELRWIGSTSAISYNIYRDGIYLDSTTGIGYTDTSASLGSHDYYITVVTAAGESGSSNTVAVTVTDAIAPINLTAATPTKSAPSLSWDGVSGVPSYDIYRDGTKIGSSTATSYIDNTVTEGTHVYYVKSVTTSNSSSDPSNSITVLYDKTAPTATGAAISGWLAVHWANPNISANASDTSSGVVTGEYYIDNDPGQGNGSPMTYDSASGKIKASIIINSGPSGWHTIHMRSKDAAGNWSPTTTVQYFYYG